MSPTEMGSVLLKLARDSLVESLCGEPCSIPDVEFLKEPGASFVTLTSGGKLRGCIGSVQAHRALGEDVVHNARGAALHDPRFPPLLASELPKVRIEVTVLSPLEPLGSFDREEEAIERLRPFVDGVLLECGARRAVFIPKMWEKLPDPRVFLAYLRDKANLPSSDWLPGIRLSRFTAQPFEEPEPTQKEASA